MTSPAIVVVGIVGHSPLAETIAKAVASTGAESEVCSETNAIAKAVTVDALVFDLGTHRELLHPIAVLLAAEPRTRWLPRVVVAPDDTPATELAIFGAARVVLASEPPETITAVIADAVEQARSRTELVRHAQTTAADARALEARLTKLHREGETLAHDVRVLFGLIVGYAGNLRDGFIGPVTDDQREKLGHVVDASTDAASLIEHYLVTLRQAVPQASPHAPAPRSVVRRHHDLAEMVRGTAALFHGIARARSITLVADAPVAVFCWCDAMMIKQALVNVLANALKFTPDGGRVVVSARLGALVEGPASMRRDAEIVVDDDGPGIPAKERGRVLERGVRLERDEAVPGTGLGLAVVRDVADLHGGWVRVDESPAGGASVALVVPVDRRGRSGEQRAVERRSTA